MKTSARLNLLGRVLRSRRHFLVATFTVAMGGLGAWSEIQGEIARGIASRSLRVSIQQRNGASADLTLSQLPDESVSIQAYMWKDAEFVSANDWNAQNGRIEITREGVGAIGTAAGTLWGGFGSPAGPTATPATLDIEMNVASTWSYAGHYSQSGVVMSGPWDESPTRLAHIMLQGAELLSLKGAAVSVKVDQEPFFEGDSGLGHLKINVVHKVENITDISR
jgi:hypothetical protein